MKYLSILFFAASVLSGLLAAHLWYKSSKVEPKQYGIEPVDTGVSNSQTMAGINVALNDAAKLNSNAAIWTAFSLGFNAISSVLGLLA